jgi:hypothetical protein
MYSMFALDLFASVIGIGQSCLSGAPTIGCCNKRVLDDRRRYQPGDCGRYDRSSDRLGSKSNRARRSLDSRTTMQSQIMTAWWPLVIFIAGQGCGLVRDLLVQSLSPDRKTTIAIWARHHGPDASVSISLRPRAGPERTVYTETRDRVPGVVEVYWSPDSKIVGVFVCDPVANNLTFAYDVASNQPLPVNKVVDAVRANVRRRYSLAEADLTKHGNDPLNWACNADRALQLYRSQLEDSYLRSP